MRPPTRLSGRPPSASSAHVGKQPDPTIESLRKAHLRETFDCGEPQLNEYLKKYARQNIDRNITQTFVAVRKPDLAVLGYYAIRMGSVMAGDLPPRETKRLPRYPVPVVHLARLATDRRVKGQGLGALLLASALKKAFQGSREIAAFAVETIAKNDQAKQFYSHFGFKSLTDDPFHMYMSMRTIAKLF